LEAIVVRPKENERISLSKCEMIAQLGLKGDNWAENCWSRLPDGTPNPDVQVSIMNARVISLLARDRERWSLTGDNLLVDFDLSETHISSGQEIAVGPVVLQITGEPHNGCDKFSERFGRDAVEFVNSPEGQRLHLRGIYARIFKGGRIQVGDEVRKLQSR